MQCRPVWRWPKCHAIQSPADDSKAHVGVACTDSGQPSRTRQLFPFLGLVACEQGCSEARAESSCIGTSGSKPARFFQRKAGNVGSAFVTSPWATRARATKQPQPLVPPPLAPTIAGLSHHFSLRLAFTTTPMPPSKPSYPWMPAPARRTSTRITRSRTQGSAWPGHSVHGPPSPGHRNRQPG